MLRIGVASCAENGQDFPGLPPWMSRLLRSRGVETAEEAQAFLAPSRNQILPPQLLQDMDQSVALLTDARKNGYKTVIYGDYDVDGVSASAILWEAFRQFGLDAAVYLPDRHTEGYGLNLPAVEKLAGEYQVMVTVDCGITGLAEVQAAKQAGMRVIVTDHHRHGEQLPPADAVITPLLGAYPFPGLCGAGVAWKLALALLGDRAEPLVEIAALATVADMVPLTGENRAMVALGLRRLSGTKRPGLRALMNRAGIAGGVSSDQVAFQIAPRMNACGRMETARIAFDMLTTRDEDQAEALALRMESLNQTRKTREAAVIAEAQAQVQAMDLVNTKAIVVCGEGWNSGVVGLAAGRIAEQYAYPTVALAREGDTCVGSARSAGDIDIYAALSQCADLFDRFGGHRQAAGLTIRADRVEEFSRRLSDAVAQQTGGLPPEPSLLCDGELNLGEVTRETVQWLDRLEPFGVGNPAPRFLCEDVSPLALRAVGANGRHLKCTFRQGNEIREGIYFGGGDMAGPPAGSYRLVMTPTVNAFRGAVTAECRLYALQLIPASLTMDARREEMAYLQETLGDETADTVDPEELTGLMRGGQGTLLVCRTLQTALALYQRFPQADFCLDRAGDPRAYHTILLYGRAADTCASYRHVVLCDGDLGEAAAFRAACPNARVCALPRTQEARALLCRVFVDQESLRRCYVALKERQPRDVDELAQRCGLTAGQTAFALKVLAEIDLADVSLSPFRVQLLPMRKRSPQESALYRRARQAKEDGYGLHSL